MLGSLHLKQLAYRTPTPVTTLNKHNLDLRRPHMARKATRRLLLLPLLSNRTPMLLHFPLVPRPTAAHTVRLPFSNSPSAFSQDCRRRKALLLTSARGTIRRALLNLRVAQRTRRQPCHRLDEAVGSAGEEAQEEPTTITRPTRLPLEATEVDPGRVRTRRARRTHQRAGQAGEGTAEELEVGREEEPERDRSTREGSHHLPEDEAESLLRSLVARAEDRPTAARQLAATDRLEEAEVVVPSRVFLVAVASRAAEVGATSAAARRRAALALLSKRQKDPDRSARRRPRRSANGAAKRTSAAR